MLLQRRKHRHYREHQTRPEPGYGIGYNPAWPSILSVAHDTADGAVVYVILDRPCILNPPGAIPFVLDGATVQSAVMAMPDKLAVRCTTGVPRGAAWTWGAAPPADCGLVDPVSGHAPNPASGFCADEPGPAVPPLLAVVVGSSASGFVCTLVFDQPVELNGNAMDGAILFNGAPPASVASLSANTLQFNASTYLNTNDPWEIVAQPGYLNTPLAVPQSGYL